MMYLPVTSVVSKEAVQILNEADRSTDNRVTENKDIEIERRSAVVSVMISKCVCMRLLQAPLETLLYLLKGCGGISIKMNIKDDSELCFSVIVSHCCDIAAEQDFRVQSMVFLLNSHAFFAWLLWMMWWGCEWQVVIRYKILNQHERC